MMRNIFILLLVIIPAFAKAQSLTLQECYQLGRENYPAIKKRGLIQQATKFSLENASKAYLPQVSIGGQATYQTDVTKIPVDMPNVKPMSKDQYRVQADVSQLIYDGGAINAQKEILKANEAVQLQNIEISFQSIKEKINDLYFGILLLDEQLAQYNLRKEVLASSLKKSEAALANGVTFRSNVSELKAEIINADMGAVEIRAQARVYKDMLGLLIGRDISDGLQLVKPQNIDVAGVLARPELKIFDLQKQMLDAQKKKYQADWMPKVSAFTQGGYGRPGLNMLDNSFQPFAIGGIRFSFPINSIYTYKNNLKIIDINKQEADADRETFLLNTKTSLVQQTRATEKYKTMMAQDDEVINLRKEVTASAQAQLDNHVITVTEFITKLNAEYLARQTRMLHELQLLQTTYNYQTISGN